MGLRDASASKKIEPERGDPGEAQRDLQSALLLLWQTVSVRVGKMGSHVLRSFLEIIVLKELGGNTALGPLH